MNIARDLMVLSIQSYKQKRLSDAGTLFAAALASTDSCEFIARLEKLNFNTDVVADVVRESDMVSENIDPEVALETEEVGLESLAPMRRMNSPQGLMDEVMCDSLSDIAQALASSMAEEEDDESDSSVSSVQVVRSPICVRS